MQRIKLSPDQVALLNQGTVLQSGHEKYYHFPFWIKETHGTEYEQKEKRDAVGYELYKFNELPEGLKRTINEMREIKDPHTEGEWQYREDDNGNYDVWVDDGEPGVLYICREIMQGEDGGRADAKLIAAAPDLRAACLMAREELCIGGDWNNAIKIIDAAIEKAEG